MAAKVRWMRGAWWVVTHYQGKRRKKKIGSTKADKRRAEHIAERINAKLFRAERAAVRHDLRTRGPRLGGAQVHGSTREGSCAGQPGVPGRVPAGEALRERPRADEEREGKPRPTSTPQPRRRAVALLLGKALVDATSELPHFALEPLNLAECDQPEYAKHERYKCDCTHHVPPS